MAHILVYSDIKNLFSIAEAKNIIFFYKKILDLVVRKGKGEGKQDREVEKKVKKKEREAGIRALSPIYNEIRFYYFTP